MVGRGVGISTAFMTVFLLLPSFTRAQDLDSLVDPYVEEILVQLAKRQGFNRLLLPDVDAAVFGTAYYVEDGDVPCFASLRTMAHRGDSLPLNALVQFPTSGLPQPRVISDWTIIRVASLIGNEAVARVSAKVQGQQALAEAAAEAFKKTNAQIIFASREVPLWNYRKAAQQQMRTEGIADLREISPQASGVITPFAQLIVQKFEFDRQLVKKESLGFMAKFLDLFSTRITGDRSDNLLEGYRLPTNAVLAIKPGFVQFRREVCP